MIAPRAPLAPEAPTTCWNEWIASDPVASSAVQRIDHVLGSHAVEDINRIALMSQEFLRDQGVLPANEAEASVHERAFPFDILPLPLAAGEWSALEAGLAQRVRAWNAFLGDIYGDQEILKAGVIPYEIVYDDPHFHRECVGVVAPQSSYVHIAAVDLVRSPNGKWIVFEDNISNPTGASYALQNRRVLGRIWPELMEGVAVESIFDFPSRLLETLQQAAPASTTGSRVVSLSPGVRNESYYDHTALARQMGIPLVRGEDLIVLDGQLFLKTIGGLERVDVLYRRFEGKFLDPVGFHADSSLGVPGLLSCLRQGTVTVANALGAGLGDNRALAGYLPQILEFYFSEQPLIDSVPILDLRDVDHRVQVFANRDRYVIKSAHSRNAGSVWHGGQLSPQEWGKLREHIEERPGHFIAQERVCFSTAPAWIDSNLKPRHVSLRTFVLNGPTVHVSPCVLTRVAAEADSLVVSSALGGSSKDTWVLRDEKRHGDRELVMRHTPRRMRLASRTAEAIYWIGRYAERIEATVRILRTVQQLRTENTLQTDPRTWSALWEALASATGHPTRFFKRASFQKDGGRTLPMYILLDERNPSSAYNSAMRLRENFQLVREALPPEMWTVVNRLTSHLRRLAEARRTARVRNLLQGVTLHDEVLDRLDELAGTSDKHMLHNDVRHFWNIGRHLERAVFTLQTTRQVFLKRGDEREAGTAVEDEINLDALLRMLAGQYAYRSSYRSRPVASQVAKLLLQDMEFPRSLLFGAKGVAYSLQRAFGDRPPIMAEKPSRHINHLVSELSFADITSYFVGEDELPTEGSKGCPSARARMKAFSDWLEGFDDRLAAFHALVSDHFFSHQAGAPAVDTE